MKKSSNSIKFTAAVAAELAAVSLILLGAGALSSTTATASSETSVGPQAEQTFEALGVTRSGGTTDTARCYGYY